MRDNDVIAYVLPFIYWVVDLPPRIQNWTGLNFQTAAILPAALYDEICDTEARRNRSLERRQQ